MDVVQQRKPSLQKKTEVACGTEELNLSIFAVCILIPWLLWGDRSELSPPLWRAASLRYVNKCLWNFLPLYLLILSVTS